MKQFLKIFLLVMVVLSACNYIPVPQGGEKNTPVLVSSDTFFSGHAWVDLNRNGQVDNGDIPLAGATFVIRLENGAEFGSQTDASGAAMVTIPGGSEGQVQARMEPPVGSDIRPLNPQRVTLGLNRGTSADFLFTKTPEAVSQSTPATSTPESPLPSPGSTEPVVALPSPGASQGASPDASPTQGEILLPTVAPFSADKLGTVDRDLTYCIVPDGAGGSLDLKMDVYYPFKMSRPAPVVVYIHGGGWVHGDKSSQDRQDLRMLRDQGFLIVTLNYRLAPQYKFPAQIEDVKCAIRHLRANAAAYNLDPAFIGAMGESAGGHLSSLLGLTDASAGFDDVGGYFDQSSRVQAVVDLYGPADLTAYEPTRRGMSTATDVFGVTSPDDPMLKIASPVTYATSDDPPFLIIQGDQDTLVPLEQSQILYQRLSEVGIPVELVIVKNAGHGFGAVGGTPSPSQGQLARKVVDFFEQNLRP